MCSLVPGLLGKGLFIDFIFLIENPRSKATWLREVPPIVNEIVGLRLVLGSTSLVLPVSTLGKCPKEQFSWGESFMGQLRRVSWLNPWYTTLPQSVPIAQLWCALLSSEIQVQNNASSSERGEGNV